MQLKEDPKKKKNQHQTLDRYCAGTDGVIDSKNRSKLLNCGTASSKAGWATGLGVSSEPVRSSGSLTAASECFSDDWLGVTSLLALCK